MTKIRITEMDHIVLNVSDIERSIAFYTGTLGLAGERLDEFRAGKVGFPSVRINEHTLIDLMHGAPANGDKAAQNLNHFCLVCEPTDLGALAEGLKQEGIEVVTGPASRWGARGQAQSIYILDPDANEIELRCY
ncbi:MAG TPA: VOC family protein [Dehalococcoidia bacterium]|jgi:catechol 2,3-dioxygenase-like lactoylglutathione lyase family enzyme|nr:VOC family protein [Dehalococcoidia bacterium]